MGILCRAEGVHTPAVPLDNSVGRERVPLVGPRNRREDAVLEAPEIEIVLITFKIRIIIVHFSLVDK